MICTEKYAVLVAFLRIQKSIKKESFGEFFAANLWLEYKEYFQMHFGVMCSALSKALLALHMACGPTFTLKQALNSLRVDSFVAVQPS